ncbi:hypothetical protein HW561_10755 [Rhodobacteraceae bacterium B1Z28]|uniref:Uncharacterized protein n=1 Tax=Ruegeria haliotis TaxID=2747601 RepID=A0ABX2PQE7_9RHOB|nr:DUF6478 family protein [Ruegeria haliotis]NVO56268.1 hypothetical protein [Ruegeria haliotis]
MGRILDRFIHRKVLGRWGKAAQQAADAPQSQLRLQRDQARSLRMHLDRLVHVADGRLARPQIGSAQFPKPVGTDWSWRPDLWRGPLARPGIASASRKATIDQQVTLFHDCPQSEIAVRQIRNRKEGDLAPFSLALEVFSFEGSFLSLSIELPNEAAQDLTRQHLMRIDALIDSERATDVFARLNIQHGPNTEQVLRKMDLSASSNVVDFDLAHLPLNERRIEKIWLDLIYDSPRMNRIVLRDLTFCRHHRADL